MQGMTDRRVLDDAVKAIVREVARKAAEEAGKAALAEDSAFNPDNVAGYHPGQSDAERARRTYVGK